MDTCGNCKHGHARLDDLKSVDCYGVPPQAIGVPVGPGQIDIKFVRAPMLKTEEACGCWKPKIVLSTLVADNG